MPDQIKGRIVFLDYMRVFAFISVLIGHKFHTELSALAADPTLHATLRLLAEGAYALCNGGAAGVTVFFITSGYIIAHVLQTETPVEFLIKRIFRIYPLYIVAVLLETLMWHHMNGAAPPPLSVWIPRLLLIGDFFGTPHALAGVEWTLRIEIMFYLFMAALKAAGVLRHQQWLPALLAGATLSLYLLPEIPGKDIWIHGYFNLYAPFLFIGTLLYVAEIRTADRRLCALVIFGIGVAFLQRLMELYPAWKESHFAALALGLFLAGWQARHQLRDGRILRAVSDLTYAVYLFHNWIWLYLESVVTRYGVSFLPLKSQVLVLLIIVCYIAHKIIERPGIQAGRYMLARYRQLRQRIPPAAATTPPALAGSA